MPGLDAQIIWSRCWPMLVNPIAYSLIAKLRLGLSGFCQHSEFPNLSAFKSTAFCGTTIAENQ